MADILDKNPMFGLRIPVKIDHARQQRQGEDKYAEYDDRTTSEQIVNLGILFVIFVATLVFTIQLKVTFKNHGKKQYNKQHYLKIVLIYLTAVSR